MNQGNALTPMQRAMAALEAFFGDECRQFDREWHTRELAREDTRLGNYWEWVVHQIEAGRQSVDEVIRAAMETIFVNVKQISTSLADPDDEGIAGLYVIAFGKNVLNASRGVLARIALDIFHSKHAIGCLEDFETVVVDGAGHFIDEDEGENGTYASFGTAEKVATPFDLRTWSPALYVEAFSDSAVANPGWARINLAPQFVGRLCTSGSVSVAQPEVGADNALTGSLVGGGSVATAGIDASRDQRRFLVFGTLGPR
jgi:hypothetical protein